jgi:hypothetical protein
MLTFHVMRSLSRLAEGRSAKYEFHFTASSEVREVGSPTRELFKHDWGVRKVVPERHAKISRNTLLIEPFIGSNRRCVIAHRYPPTYAKRTTAPAMGTASSAHSRVVDVVR